MYFIMLFFISGCSFKSSQTQGDPTTLKGLQAMAGSSKRSIFKKETISRIKEMALKEIALSLGAQAGLSARANSINDNLVQQQRTLDSVYNFNALILDHNILPPVLLEGRQILNLANAQTIRISDRTYKVYRQARFITTPLNWRQYLWMDYKPPEYPNVNLLPKTKEERAIWRYYVTKGWNQGIEQANIILQDNLARIKEDFKGMILYRKLLAMNMVSPPYVSNTDLGVTGDGSEIHIDDRVLRITALPELNVNSEEWRAAVIKDQQYTLDQLAMLEKEADATPIVIQSKSWRPVINPIN
ncbi:MAG: type IV secretion system protein DotC [Legionellales bacterium RIFCSPHIGHO2_12_FULL_37_14]|nr:MAG: type IV secretion system protein DotC [Legionellales bacterium RIFCSPHIGHO2_12_FULL_37_14]